MALPVDNLSRLIAASSCCQCYLSLMWLGASGGSFLARRLIDPFQLFYGCVDD